MFNRTNRSMLAIAAACGLAATIFDARRAMIVNSPIFNEISGKLGGAVGMTSAAGMQLRGNVTPNNPLTTQQVRIRNILASLASYWRSTMSATNSTNWGALAGQAESGIDVFVAANTILLQGAGARVVAAPTTRAGVFTPFTAGASSTPAVGEIAVDASGKINWNPANATDDYNAAAGGVINFSISKQQSPSRASQQFNVTWVGSKVRGGSATTGAQTVTCPTTYTTGQIVYVRVTSAGVDGKVAPSQLIRLTVVA